MDQNILTLIEQSRKYSNSKNKFFQNKLLINLSPSKEYSKQVAQTENIQFDRYQSREALSGKNSNKKQFNFTTFFLNLANQDLQQFPKGKYDYLNIQIIDLSNNRFRYFPKEIYPMQEAKKLNLNSNFIKLLPEDLFSKFPLITQFQISNNLITQIPTKITQWGNTLHYLDISKNKITDLSPLKLLLHLTTLFIQSNEFQLLPCGLYHLDRLDEFGLDWFKYVNPPLPQVTTDSRVISLLFNHLEQIEKRESEDSINLNFSDEDQVSESGLTFQSFLLFFSQQPLQILPNPQQGDIEQQSTIIHKAAKEQDIGALISLINYYPDMVDCEDQYQHTALGLAIQEEKYFSAKALLFNGAGVNRGKTNYGSILNLAIVKGQIHLILDILGQGADPMVPDKHGNTALHYCMACFDRDLKIYKQAFQNLMKHHIDPNVQNKDGWTPLHVAIKKGIIEAVQAILLYNEKGIRKFNLNQKGGKKRMSPLHLACINCHYEIVQLLLESKSLKVLARNKLNQLASDLCRHNYRLYKLLKRAEQEQIIKIIKYDQHTDQDEYSFKEYDSYTDLDESIYQFDGLQLKMGKINRNVLGLRERATGHQKRNNSQPNLNYN